MYLKYNLPLHNVGMLVALAMSLEVATSMLFFTIIPLKIPYKALWIVYLPPMIVLL